MHWRGCLLCSTILMHTAALHNQRYYTYMCSYSHPTRMREQHTTQQHSTTQRKTAIEQRPAPSTGRGGGRGKRQKSGNVITSLQIAPFLHGCEAHSLTFDWQFVPYYSLFIRSNHQSRLMA